MDVANINEVKDLIKRGAHFYVGHSGGKDSHAMYARLNKIIPADRIHVVHADLGKVEHAGIKDFIRDHINGRELLIAKAIHADGSEKDFISAVRARRKSLDDRGAIDAPAWPSSAARFCTSDLKTGPIWKVIKAHAKKVKASIVVNCVGIRAEESKSRAKKINSRGSLNINKKNSIASRESWDWWPIAHWPIGSVWDEIASVGEKPHPAYSNGNDRLSCVFCIFGSRSDLKNGYESRPELFKELSDLEKEVRGTMFHGESLAERIGIEVNPAVPDDLDPGTNLCFEF